MLIAGENPSYITVVQLYGCYHVNLMEWDERADGYLVTISKNLGSSKGAAWVEAHEWAKREGLEVR